MFLQERLESLEPRLALATSGRAAPFHRWMLHRHAPQAAPAGVRAPAPSLQLR